MMLILGLSFAGWILLSVPVAVVLGRAIGSAPAAERTLRPSAQPVTPVPLALSA